MKIKFPKFPDFPEFPNFPKFPDLEIKIVLCPACMGQKTQSKPPHIAGDARQWTSTNVQTYPCVTCDAKGYIILP